MENEITKNNEDFIENSLININEVKQILSRRKKIILFTSSLVFLFSLANLTYKRLINPQYLGSFSIMIKDPILEKERRSSGAGFIEELAINQTYSDIPTLIQYLKSEKVIQKTAKINNLVPSSLSNRINITLPSFSQNPNYLPSILKVDVIGPDKFKLNKIIQNLSEDYISIASNTKKERLTVGINFLENEKPTIESRAFQVQDELEKFRLKHKLIDPIKLSVLLRSRIETTKNDQLMLEGEKVRLLFIKSNLDNGILSTERTNTRNKLSGLDISDSDQLLLKEISKVKSSLAKAQSTYKKTSTIVLNLEAKLSQLEPLLLEKQKSAVDAAILIIDGKIKSNKNKLEELDKEFSTLPPLINEYSKLSSKQVLIEQNLSNLLEAKETLKLELSQGTLPWKIISKPFVSPRPYQPEIKKHLFYGLLISLISGLSVAFIINKIDNVFHFPEDIEKENNFPPLLGFIPFFKFGNSKDSDDDSYPLSINDFLSMPEKNKSLNFIFEETFRNLYTSIKFSATDRTIRSIAITSTIPSEGKSLFSSLLGLNSSEIDKKILIIEADLRRPSLHKKLNVDNVIGLSNVLVDDKYSWQDAVNTLDKFPNLSYITGGKTPPNPIKLLDSKKMKSFIEEIYQSKKYDLIILDCPPLLGLSDSLIISQLVDGVILTISLNKVKKEMVKESIQKLNFSSAEIIGLVANTTKENNDNIGFRNKYYYQYNYGYQNKYLPLETNNAYSNIDNEKDDSANDKFSYNFSNILKIFNKFKKDFIKWLNE